MSGYNSEVKVYYCGPSGLPSNSNKISPSPSITISPEIYYANDNVIGYTYNITLNGYANSLRKDLDEGSADYGVDKTVDHIGYIRQIFNTNGGKLYVKQGGTDNNGANLLVAKGATVKSLNFEASDNRWVNYSPFTIELEFNEVDFIGCSGNSTIPCSGSIFHTGQNNNDIINNLVDITKYKLKSFSDKWSITIDNSVYESTFGLNNRHGNIFRVSYDLSATGKNYYNDNGTLIPAWQQAKDFVQERLVAQVSGLINGILLINPDSQSACEGNRELSALHELSTDSPPISSGLMSEFVTLNDNKTSNENINYDIYNETITCSTSESDGSFGIVYNSILKRSDPSLNPAQNSVLHDYKKEYTISSLTNSPEATITIQGTVQGLVRGGFIYYNFNEFKLPNNGTFLLNKNAQETKYSNALSFYNGIIGNNNDLFNNTKSFFGITKSELFVKQGNSPNSVPEIPSSFVLDHNYNQGSVVYTATYTTSSTRNFNHGLTNVSIKRKDPVDITQEFFIPGRASGPIIQKLDCFTPTTITISVDGVNPSLRDCNSELFKNPCVLRYLDFIVNLPININIPQSSLITNQNFSVNSIDGSFSIFIEYIE